MLRNLERAGWALGGAGVIVIAIASFAYGRHSVERLDAVMPCAADEALVWTRIPGEGQSGEARCVLRAELTVTFRETMVFAAGGFEPMPCGEDDVLRWDEYPETAECENLYDIIGDAIDAAEGRDDDEPSGRYADLP